MAKELSTTNLERANAVCTAIGVFMVEATKGEGAATLLTSWDRNTLEGLQRLEKHECDVVDNGKSMVNRDLSIIAFSMKPMVIAREDGQIDVAPALTLETEDGKLFTVTGQTAIKSFASRLRTHLAQGELGSKNPLKLRLTLQEGNENRSYYWFVRY